MQSPLFFIFLITQPLLKITPICHSHKNVACYGGDMAYDFCFKMLMLHVGMSGMPTVHQKY